MKTAIAVAAVLCLLFPSSGSAVAAAQPEDGGQEGACVILLHGLARTSGSMATLAETLSAAGYDVVNINYPSTKKPIEALAMTAVSEGIRECRQMGIKTIHFVSHSMGGLLVRYYLSRCRLPELGRTVMLSPPNQGSEVADRLKNTTLFRLVTGPAGQQLGTGEDGIARHLPPVDYPVGVITGEKAKFFDKVFSDMIPGKDDGKVSVERAKVDGMDDFLSLPYGHTFIMDEDAVIYQVVHFLKNGKFQKDQEPDNR